MLMYYDDHILLATCVQVGGWTVHNTDFIN
jgi:hypothetical protein